MKKRTVMLLMASFMVLGTAPAAFAEEAAGTKEAASGTEEAAAEAEEEAVDIASLKVLGEKKEEDFEVVLKNATGKDIKAIAVSVDDEEAGENLLPEGEVFAKDELRVLYVTPRESDSVPEYDIHLTYDDDSEGLIHTFPFGDADRADLSLKDAVSYLLFKSISQDKDYDTYEAEKAVIDAANAAASAASSSSGSDYSYEESYDDYSYDDYSYDDYSYDDYTYEETSDSSDDNCQPDGLF